MLYRFSKAVFIQHVAFIKYSLHFICLAQRVFSAIYWSYLPFSTKYPGRSLLYANRKDRHCSLHLIEGRLQPNIIAVPS